MSYDLSEMARLSGMSPHEREIEALKARIARLESEIKEPICTLCGRRTPHGFHICDY